MQMADTYLERLDNRCKQLGFGSWEELLNSKHPDLNKNTFQEFEDIIVDRIWKVSDEKFKEDHELRMYPYVFVPYLLPIFMAHFGFNPRVTIELNTDNESDVTVYIQKQGDQYIFGDFLCQDIVVLMLTKEQYETTISVMPITWCPTVVERRKSEHKKAYMELVKVPSHPDHTLIYMNQMNFFDL